MISTASWTVLSLPAGKESHKSHPSQDCAGEIISAEIIV